MDSHTWIFVSHSSADLKTVRKVRNYLEDKGASPLLFHLLSLKDPEEFWPLIQREIEERNFFLYCESESAETSVWVKRERDAVEAARMSQPKRVGLIRVDQSEPDFSRLDALLTKTRVFPSYAYKDAEIVRGYIAALRKAGFSVFDAKDSLPVEANWQDALATELKETSRDGWVVVFLSARSLQSAWVQSEINASLLLGSRLVPVLIESVPIPPQLASIQAFDGTIDPKNAAVRLTNELLKR